jgi:2-oxo-4-hydroxy-4-carboxy-5-ureidoimidazoline decarboxylase
LSERGIGWFNSLSAQKAQDELFSCFANREWAARVAARRPLRDVDALVAVGGGELPDILQGEIWDGIIRSHPRIGERGGHAPAKSEREQSGLRDASPETMAALAAENRRYEEKFGRAFIIRAAGRNAEQILQALRRRINLDPVIELVEVVEELHDITEGRLRELVDR